MKKYVFESLKFFCAAILCTILTAFATPSHAALPDGYTELQYIESTGTQWIDTGFTANGGMIVDAKALPINGSLAIGSNANPLGSSRNILAYANGNYIPQKLTYTTYRLADDGTSPVIIHFDTTNTKFYCKLNETTLVDINNTGTLQDLTTTVKISYSDYERNTYPGRFYYVQIRDKDGILVRDFVPAKNSSGVVGMYDTVNNRFYTNAGTGDFIAGDPVYVCNLFNKNATNTNNGYIGNAYLNQEGTAVTTNSYATSEYINVQPSTTYFWKIGEGTSHSAPRIAYYDANRNYIASSNLIGYSTSFTTPSNCAYVRLPLYKNEIGVAMLTKGDTAPTSYIAYNPNCGCDGTVVNYTSATGTGVQSGTPTPTNPIEPTFYKQGNMILRKVGDVADSYDASTGKITRRVGVKVFDGTENWGMQSINDHGIINFQLTRPSDWAYPLEEILTSHFRQTTEGIAQTTEPGITVGANLYVRMFANVYDTVEKYKQWLAQQYAAGTPVTVWYPLETETTEDWPASQCTTEPIKIATTKYNETKFSPLNTALANAISVVDTVVSNTITQAASIATLQAQKQTRPDETCPAGKKCLLVEDANGVPHWYEIVENAWDLPAGYTQLEYLQGKGSTHIVPGVTINSNLKIDIKYEILTPGWLLGGTTGESGRWGVTSSNTFFSGTSGVADISSATNLSGINTATFNYRTGATVNGVNIPFGTEQTYGNVTAKQFYLFSADGTGVSTQEHKIYYANIYNGETLIRNLVPAKRNSDDVLGMYDTVEGRFYENAGTGEFIAGDPVAE